MNVETPETFSCFANKVDPTTVTIPATVKFLAIDTPPAIRTAPVFVVASVLSVVFVEVIIPEELIFVMVEFVLVKVVTTPVTILPVVRFPVS